MNTTPTTPAKRSALRGLLRLFGILLGGIVLGFALLVASFLLPVDRMEQNVLLSVPALDGTWGTGEESYEQVIKGYETTQLDNSTDAYMLLSAIHRSDTDAVEQAINVYTYHHDVYFRQFDTLKQLAQTGYDQMSDTATTRYWLGYLIVLKPLLLLFTYMDIRMLNTLAQGMLLLGIILGMQRRGLGRYVLPFGLSMILLTPSVTGLSLQFSTAFYVMGVAMLLLLWKPNLVRSRLGDAAFFLLTGMATSYFDFLTYPLVTFGMPFVLYLLMHEKDEPCALLRCLLRCGAAWCVGYGGMWAGKWLIAALYGNTEFWSSVVGSIEVRTSTEGTGEVIGRTEALQRVFSVFAKKAYLPVALGVIAGYGVALAKVRKACKAGIATRAEGSPMLYVLLGVVALLPLCWFFFTANHTYNHAFYTSRALMVTVFAVLCAVARLCKCTQTATPSTNPPTHPGI